MKPKSVEPPRSLPETVPPKRGRGRPQKVRPSEITGRADNYRGILQNVWESLWPPLSEAKTGDDVIAALQNARPYDREFVPWASLILTVLKDLNLPKRQRSRVNFLADSLAGLGIVTPRRSRDICAQERAKARHAHHIIRYEFYLECSCGYTGHSQDHACPTCGTACWSIAGPVGHHPFEIEHKIRVSG